MTGFSMSYFPVGGALAGLVDAVWVMRSPFAEIGGPVGSLLPQLHWGLQGQIGWTFPGGRCVATPPAAVVGPSSGAMTLHVRGPAVAVGVGLYPEGWTGLVGEPAHRLTADAADLVGLWGCAACRPLALSPEAPDRVLADHLVNLLQRRYAMRRSDPDPRIGLIARWADEDGGKIDHLAQELGIGARQLDRLVGAWCGLPPRRLANKQRALRIATALAEGQDVMRGAWTTLYADQAHFIRDFRRFIGVTPGVFMSDQGRLVRSVFEVRRQVSGVHPLGLGRGSAPLDL